MPKLDIDDVTIAFEDRNASDPRIPVVLLTGLSGAGVSWGVQRQYFASTGRRTIVPDQRGTGESTGDIDGQTLARHADDVAELLTALDIQSAHIVGSSTGGAIGQHLALRHPQLVKTIVPVATWARTDEYFRRWFELRMLIAADHTPEDHADLTMLLLFSPQFRRDHPEVIADMREKALKRNPDIGMTLARMRMIVEHNVFDDLKTIDIPALVIGGDRDMVCPPHLARELASCLRRSEYVNVVEAGHFVHLEQAELFFETVSAFISVHD